MKLKMDLYWQLMCVEKHLYFTYILYKKYTLKEGKEIKCPFCWAENNKCKFCVAGGFCQEALYFNPFDKKLQKEQYRLHVLKVIKHLQRYLEHCYKDLEYYITK